MDGRLILCFRAASGGGRGLLERARALDLRARVRGGTLVAWDGRRVAFAFDHDALAEAIGLVSEPEEDAASGEPPWAVGVAEGALERLAEDRGDLAGGPAVVAACALADAARPGEMLVATSVRALADGTLIGGGSRVGREGGVRVRGARVDPARPYRTQAARELARMRTTPLVAAPVLREPVAAGALVVLRADPGMGGTRWLGELASASPRALVVSPVGSGFEPLGALRRALGRSISRDLNPLLLETADALEALLAGEGASLDVAARLVSAFHWRKAKGEAPGLVLLDDAKAIDPASVEACVRAARAASATFGVVARLDATGGLPSTLAALPKVAELELRPLTNDEAMALAGGATNDALSAIGRTRWARLGGNVPLGVVEAVASGIVSGDIVWSGDVAAPRSRAAGRGKVRTASQWIAVRAHGETEASRAVLVAIALLGGEAKVSRVARVLDRANVRADVPRTIEELVSARWLVDTQEDWIALPSRTHREALSALLDEPARKAIHAAAADVIEEEEGGFGRVEAGWHAAQAGDAKRASRILLATAKLAAEGRLDASTTQLIAFARRVDPECEEGAMELLANALSRPSLPPPRGVSLPPPSSSERQRTPSVEILMPGSAGAGAPSEPTLVDVTHDSEPPTIAKSEAPPAAAAAAAARPPVPKPPPLPSPPPLPADAMASSTPSEPPSMAGTQIATRLGELAKDALLAADNAALERWVDGLRAAGESPVFTERMRAMARLGRGDIGDALRVLRRTREQVDPADHKRRCQTSLALGVALSVAGRHEDALLEGLDALARARQVGDERGARACLAFLAKLFASVGQAEQAARLRGAPGAL